MNIGAEVLQALLVGDTESLFLIHDQQAKVLEPSTFTMSEWTAAFAPEKAGIYPCKAEWEKATPKGIEDIYSYLYKFAKDSPTPAKCK